MTILRHVVAPALSLLAIVSAPPANAQTILSDSIIQSILAKRVDAHASAGLVVGTLYHGQPRIVAYGHMNGDSSAALDGNTVFEIGSVSKTFTGTLLADMVARGEVKLEDPVAKYLPAGVKMPSRDGHEITLLDLATQSSGLPRMPTNFKPKDPRNPFADYTVPQLYEFLSGYTLPRDPGAQYEYSNLGMGLLGHVLALRAGKSYEALLTERILKPLRMNDTRITLTPSMQQRFATGHDGQMQPVLAWDLPTLAGAGAIRSTANDMLKYVAANIAPAGTALAKSAPLAQEPKRDAGAPMRIGLAWQVYERGGQRFVWHNGETGGFHSFVAFNPATGVNVVVLSNSNSDIDDIGRHVMDPSLPLVEPKAAVARNEVTVPVEQLQKLVGEYQLAPNFSIKVALDGFNLSAEPTGQGTFRLFAESPTEFFLKVVDAQLTFQLDSSGSVTGLILHQNGATVPGKKVK